MTTYNIRKLRSGRIADENPSTWVGQLGTIFYDEATGALRISDGVTPGGVNLPFAIANTTTVGGIKAGPGANVSVDGILTIDTSGLPLGIGNISIIDNVISSVNADADVILESNGTGNVELVGNVHFHTTSQGPTGTPFFEANSDGQITVRVPASDPMAGAFKIVGSTSGLYSAPVNTGVMLQVTGNSNDASRIYNDSIGSWAAFVGRRINGNVASPTQVLAGDEIIRISSTGYNGNNIPGSGSARIVFQAKENYTTTAQGSNLSIWATALTSTTLSKIATFDVESGATVTKAAVQGNLTVSGYNTGKWIRSVRDAGVIADGGTLTVNLATDALVTCVWGNGMTMAYTGFMAGRVVKVMATKASGTGVDTLNLDGVTAAQTSTGTLTLNGTADTTTFLEITCTGTSIANVFIKT